MKETGCIGSCHAACSPASRAIVPRVASPSESTLGRRTMSLEQLPAAALCAVSVALHGHGPVHRRHRRRLSGPSRHRRHGTRDRRRHCPDDAVATLAAQVAEPIITLQSRTFSSAARSVTLAAAMKTHFGTVEPSKSACSRRGRILGVGIAILLAASIGACTTTMYAGARRPSAEIAVISSGSGTTLSNIDGTPVDGGSAASYEVLPGEHLIRMQGHASQFMGFYTRVYTSRPINLCFATKPGHRYQVSCQRQDGWYAEVVDSATLRPVVLGCPKMAAQLRQRREALRASRSAAS